MSAKAYYSSAAADALSLPSDLLCTISTRRTSNLPRRTVNDTGQRANSTSSLITTHGVAGHSGRTNECYRWAVYSPLIWVRCRDFVTRYETTLRATLVGFLIGTMDNLIFLLGINAFVRINYLDRGRYLGNRYVSSPRYKCLLLSCTYVVTARSNYESADTR